MVMAIGIAFMCTVAVLFYTLRVPTIVYYLTVPPMTSIYGYAVSWALSTANRDLALVMAAWGGLLGVQLAWVLTTRIPRR